MARVQVRFDMPPRPEPPRAPWGWVQVRGPRLADGMHLLPINDVEVHYIADDCQCEPVLDEGGFMAHNAFDGRERYEQGDALRH
jgi:hypothetical protein